MNMIPLTVDEKALINAVWDPARLNLLNILLTGPEKYLSELAKETQMDRATLSYHLDILEKVGILRSQYRILDAPKSKGRAARYYFVDEQKYSEAVSLAQKVLPVKSRSKPNV